MFVVLIHMWWSFASGRRGTHRRRLLFAEYRGGGEIYQDVVKQAHKRRLVMERARVAEGEWKDG